MEHLLCAGHYVPIYNGYSNLVFTATVQESSTITPTLWMKTLSLGGFK